MWNCEEQKAVGRKQKAESSTRLGRRDLRKGSAFPETRSSHSDEVMPRRFLRGVASQIQIQDGRSERRSLSAHQSGKATSPGSSPLRVVVLLLLTAYCPLLTGSCRRDMQDQPKTIAYRQSSFFRDGISARPPVEGTVPRGYLREDRELFFGKKSGSVTAGSSQRVVQGRNPATAGSQNSLLPATNVAALYPDDVDTFPLPITKEALERGQERYQIFCSVCHGMTGYGDGIVARRGFNRPAPANYHQDRLRQAPVGHFFDVMTNGWGAMPSYASQIGVEDRWKIIAYIRALQLSQMPPGRSAQTTERGSSGAPPRGQPK